MNNVVEIELSTKSGFSSLRLSKLISILKNNGIINDDINYHMVYGLKSIVPYDIDEYNGLFNDNPTVYGLFELILDYGIDIDKEASIEICKELGITGSDRVLNQYHMFKILNILTVDDMIISFHRDEKTRIIAKLEFGKSNLGLMMKMKLLRN